MDTEILLNKKTIKSILEKNKDFTNVKTISCKSVFNSKYYRASNLEIEDIENLNNILIDYKNYLPNLENIIIQDDNIIKKGFLNYENILVDEQIKTIKFFDGYNLLIKNNDYIKLYHSNVNYYPSNLTDYEKKIDFQYRNGCEIICIIEPEFSNLPIGLKNLNLILDYDWNENILDEKISVTISGNKMKIPFGCNVNLYVFAHKEHKIKPKISKIEFLSIDNLIVKYNNVDLNENLITTNNVKLQNTNDTGGYYYRQKSDFYDGDESILAHFL